MRASRKLVVSFAFSTILCSGAAAEERLDLRVRRVDSEWVDQAEYLSPRLGVLSSAGDLSTALSSGNAANQNDQLHGIYLRGPSCIFPEITASRRIGDSTRTEDRSSPP